MGVLCHSGLQRVCFSRRERHPREGGKFSAADVRESRFTAAGESTGKELGLNWAQISQEVPVLSL